MVTGRCRSGFMGVFLALQLSVCAAAQVVASTASDQQAKAFTPPSGKAAIYVYRNSSVAGFGGKAVRLQMILDGRMIGYLTTDTYFMVEVDPGEHDLWVGWENFLEPKLMIMPITAVAGQSYFVRSANKEESHKRVDPSAAQRELLACCVLAVPERKVATLFR